MQKFKKILKWMGVAILFLLLVAGSLYMIYLRPAMERIKQSKTIKYDKELTLVIGGGGNTGLLVSDSLVLVMDTKMDESAKTLYNTAKQLAGNKPILVINTHMHSDHCEGNKLYKGQTIIAGGNYTKEFWIKEAGKESLPSQWLADTMDIKMGDETVTIINLGKNIHTPSDIIVYLHKRKMLFGGDIILNKQAPAILGSADPDAYLTALKWIQKQFDIEKVVPGHGDMGGIEIIQNFIQYFNDMKLAAKDESREEELISKYKDWNQIPLVMSPGATARAFKKKM
jgi:glyoxylase-like metal-dependent hydrolase (beta-lactamase superfamily II)